MWYAWGMNILSKACIVCGLGAVALTGCETTKGVTPAAPEADVRTERTVTVELESNPTTGFSWQCDIADTSVATLAESSYQPYAVPEGITGSGGTETFVLAVRGAGSTAVTFTYRRPWAGGETAEVRHATLTVDDSGNGAITFLD